MGKRLLFRLITLAIGVFCISSMLYSQTSYKYTAEDFEDSAWNAYGSVNASSGTWQTASNNIRTNAVAAQSGSYCLVVANKSGSAITTPRLADGAGILTFYALKTSSSRTFSVLTSTDGTNFTQFGSAITLAAVNVWYPVSLQINDASVKYIRLTVSSNGSAYIDNLLVTQAGAAGVSVTTSAVTGITQTTAVGGGTVTSANAAAITARGLCFGLNPLPDTSASKVFSAGTTGAFTCTMTGLQPNNTYHVRAFAIAENAVTYGEEIVFNTLNQAQPVAYWMQDFNNPAQLPSSNPSSQVEITVPDQGTWKFLGAYKATNASYICDGSAMDLRITKNGSYVITPVLSAGVAGISFFEGRGDRTLNLYKSVDTGLTWTPLQTVTTSRCEAVLVSVNDSSINRIKISNESSSDADIDNLTITAVPSGAPPVVITNSTVTSLTRTSVTCGGQVTSQGSKSVRARGICVSVTPLPVVSDLHTSDGAGTGSFTSQLNTLAAGTKYYLRAYASSLSGTGYGEQITFTTQNAIAPVVTTAGAYNITATSASAGGSVTDSGGTSIAACGVCYSTSGSPTVNEAKTTDTLKSGQFVSRLEGLAPGTKYYFRAYAINNAGVGYGSVDSLTTTTASLPSVSTANVTNITSATASSGGSITNTGNATITACGVCWNTKGSPTLGDNKTTDTLIAGQFTSALNGLAQSSKYYLRAYATNIAGTVYGNEIFFTTTTRNIIYVSTSGNDTSGNGTQTKPFYSLQKAIDAAVTGDSISVKGGTYNYNTRINISANGQPGAYINIAAPKGERAILDFSAMPLNDANQGIRITGSYWHIYGLDIKGAGDNGMLIERDKGSDQNYVDIKDHTWQAHDNIIEFCSFYENRDAGLQLKNLAAYNKIINCDSYFNRDPGDGNADGFAPKLTVGTGNYFYGCRSWQNSDDGFDLYLKCEEEGFPQDMLTTIENCWCFMNGFLKDGTEGSGNGNGFKLGGSSNRDQRHDVILIRCLSFDNLQKGFDQNNNVGNMTLINCTGFAKPYLANSNHYTYKIDGTALAPGKKLIHTNCVAVSDGIADAKKSKWAPCQMIGGEATTCNYQTSDTDYITIDTTGVRGQRKADGSLPDINFMHIKPGNTKLVDKGTVVAGLLYAGSAPDLGAFETGILSDVASNNAAPNSFMLMQNYPNPFNPSTTIKFAIPKAGFVNLAVYDILGRRVAQLLNEHRQAGNYEIKFDAANLPSGIYLYRLNTGSTTEVKKMMLLK